MSGYFPLSFDQTGVSVDSVPVLFDVIAAGTFRNVQILRQLLDGRRVAHIGGADGLGESLGAVVLAGGCLGSAGLGGLLPGGALLIGGQVGQDARVVHTVEGIVQPYVDGRKLGELAQCRLDAPGGLLGSRGLCALNRGYEAGVIISGGHTIHGSEPLYGLAVTGFAKPEQIRKNDAAKPGDALILTKKLGVGILTTAAKAGMMTDRAVMDRLYRQMTQLNKTACEVMQRYRVHSCTDVTGFALMGHSCEMAQGSGCTLHLQAGNIPFHPEALEMADMGLVPAGAYRNRDFAEKTVELRGEISRAMQDILYDPQTSGGLLIAVDGRDGEALLRELRSVIPDAAMIGYAAEKEDKAIVVEG